MNKYIKEGKVIAAGAAITVNGRTYVNPTPERYAEAGWTPAPEAEEVDLDHVISDKIEAIHEYDGSSAVNSFKLNGEDVWLDKATRVGVVNAINATKALGEDTVTLGLGSQSYEIDCDKALAMMYALEAYALKCYNRTLAHINWVRACDTAEQVESYDHTAGYPEHPSFII